MASSFPAELLEADANTALQALAQAGDRGTDLIGAWVKAGNAGAIDALARLGSGESKKAAKRGLHVLRARGITVERKAHVADLSPTSERASVEARMIPPDAAGNLILVITAKSPSSRAHTAFVVLNDGKGLLSVQSGELSQSQLKDAVQRALPGLLSRPASVPVEWARYRIDRAIRLHQELGTPLPLGLSRAKELLGPVPDDPPEHPFEAEGLVLSDEDADEQSELSRALHQLPEFAAWLPEKETVDELLERLGTHFAPGEQPGEARLRELLESEMVWITDRYFDPERRERLVSAMRDAALGVLQREGETKALGVVGAMTVIGRSTAQAASSSIPFLRAFFEKAVNFRLLEGRGQLRIPVSSAPKAAGGEDEERRWGAPETQGTRAPDVD